jgi:hypothetical protein
MENSVTVLFEQTDQPQVLLCRRLDKVVHDLEKRGLAKNAHVETVFPGEERKRLKGTFVVIFSGVANLVVDALSAVPGVEKAYIAPSRR